MQRNPNIVDVYAQRLPGYEFDCAAAAESECDDDMQTGKRARDADIGIAVPGLGGGDSDPAAAAAPPEKPSDSREGVFMYDWESGTPYDDFDFGALQRHLKRKVEMLADPVIKFIADVAARAGTSIDHMLANNSPVPVDGGGAAAKRQAVLPPVVKTDAKTVEELLNGSNLTSSVLVPLLAIVLNEILEVTKARAAAAAASVKNEPVEYVPAFSGKGKEEEEEDDVVMATPLKKSPPKFLVPKSEPPVMPKSEPPFSPSKKINSCIALLEENRSCRNPHVLLAFDMPSLLIGPQFGGGRAQQQPPPQAANPLLDDLLRVMNQYAHSAENTERWVWNNLPENVGMALVRPEVIGAIEGAHQDIRALSGSHGSIKLWHLMTSPGVRHHFSAMVAALLNANPSEIQYPHYTRNFRDNGAATGARVSSGFWSQARSARQYQEKVRVFKSVGYGPATKWTDTQNRLPNAEARIKQLRTAVERNIVDVARSTLSRSSPNSLWMQLGSDDTDTYKIAIANLYHLRESYKRAVNVTREEEEEWKRLNHEQFPQSLLDGQLRKATDAKKLSSDARKLVERAQALVNEDVASIPNGDPTRPWKRAMGVDGSYMIPFVGFGGSGAAITINIEGGIPVNFTRTDVNGLLVADGMYGQRLILAAADELITKFAQVLNRIQVWRGPGAVTVREGIHQSLVDTSDLVANLRMLDSESATFAEDTRRMHSFTDDEKVELFYHKPVDIVPVRDYLSGGSFYAQI